MSHHITEIQGIGEHYGQLLESVGIADDEQLLEACRTRARREKLSEQLDISEGHLLKFVNQADLMRIKGIGPEYAELLEAAEVETVQELSKREARPLFFRLEELNRQKLLVNQVAAESQIYEWIEQAKKLPRLVMH